MAIAAVSTSVSVGAPAAVDSVLGVPIMSDGDFAQLIAQLCEPAATDAAACLLVAPDEAPDPGQTGDAEESAELSAEMMALLGVGGASVAVDAVTPANDCGSTNELESIAANYVDVTDSAPITASDDTEDSTSVLIDQADSTAEPEAPDAATEQPLVRDFNVKPDKTRHDNHHALPGALSRALAGNVPLLTESVRQVLDNQAQSVMPGQAQTITRDPARTEADTMVSDHAVSAAPSAVNALAAAFMGSESVAPRHAAPVEHSLHAAVGSSHWVTELGNKLSMMVAGEVQSANLHLHPEELGPVQVQIDTRQDEVSVWFAADHADTRSALEQSLPKLRELFASQGMSLLDAGVSGNATRQQGGQRRATNWSATSALIEPATTPSAIRRHIELSLLDTYA